VEWRTECRNGGMVEWWNGAMVEWRNGIGNGIAEWWNGGRNGVMAEWRNCRMAEWQNGGNGGMAEWQNGGNGGNGGQMAKIGYIRTIYGTHRHRRLSFDLRRCICEGFIFCATKFHMSTLLLLQHNIVALKSNCPPGYSHSTTSL
jgi:hypothetical protein